MALSSQQIQTFERITVAREEYGPTISVLAISKIERREPNPYGPNVYQHVYDHARRLGLVIDKENYFDHITMSAYLWPYTSPERLSALAYFNTIGYYINDTIASDMRRYSPTQTAKLQHSVAQKAHDILIKGKMPEGKLDKYDMAFLDLRHSIIGLSNAEFAERFFQILLEHWQAAMTCYEKCGMFEGRIDEFITIRRVASGMIPTIALIEFARNEYIPSWLPEYVPTLQIAIDALADIGGLSNELFSYAKEVLESGTTLNLVAVVERVNEYDSTIYALEDAIETVNNCFDVFKLATSQACYEASIIEDPVFREQAEAFLTGFIDQMWDMAAACYHWQVETNRYRSENHPFTDLRVKLAA